MRLGIDVGGTFTDFALYSEGRLLIYKVPTAPDPSRSVLQGLADLGLSAGLEIVHGSTVATNALLERNGARTALITTQGVKDVLEIGRQTRLRLYDLVGSRPEPLVPSELRFEVVERVNWRGDVVVAMEPEQIHRIIRRLMEEGVESVAVCLLFSFLSPLHEIMVTEMIGDKMPALPVSLSHRVLPEYREYERTSTTVVNAYVMPLVQRYLQGLINSLAGSKLQVMQSNGGIISPEQGVQQAIKTVLSGPAGGVVGALYLAKLAGYDEIITLDMGGTSTDVSLCPGWLPETTEGKIAGYPIKLPMLDIHTVGAGGGSIARTDIGGALVVGPESAGANPGPACYGQGGPFTVTDANLVLGRLPAAYFLGGRMRLDEDGTWKEAEAMAAKMGRSPIEAAEGVVALANSNMERALRVISVQRGHDPRRFTLVAFGGAGPLHACQLAEALLIPRIMVPPYPGVLSALGMLLADTVKDYSQTAMLSGSEVDLRTITRLFASLESRARQEMRADGFQLEEVVLQRSLDMRYAGQSYELAIPFDEDYLGAFHRIHQARYGYSRPGEATEIVNVRVKATAAAPKPVFQRENMAERDAAAAIVGDTSFTIEGKPTTCKVYDRSLLAPGARLGSPALVAQTDATTFIPPGWQARVDGYRNLILERTYQR